MCPNKVGRPVAENPKCIRLEIRLTQEQAKEIEQFAELHNITKTEVLLKGFELLQSTSK